MMDHEQSELLRLHEENILLRQQLDTVNKRPPVNRNSSDHASSSWVAEWEERTGRRYVS